MLPPELFKPVVLQEEPVAAEVAVVIEVVAEEVMVAVAEEDSEKVKLNLNSKMLRISSLFGSHQIERKEYMFLNVSIHYMYFFCDGIEK